MRLVEEVCTITAKGQTTVPKTVRIALGVGYGSRIAFRIEGNNVTVHAIEEDFCDPALVPFLTLLESDLLNRPTEALMPLTAQLAQNLDQMATEAGDFDPDTPIEGEVSI